MDIGPAIATKAPSRVKPLFLATTGLSSTWPDDGPDAFLGAWCFRFPDDAELARRANIATYPWASSEARIKGAEFCQDLTRRLAAGLAAFFSELIQEELDERRALLLLGLALAMSIHPAYHHFVCLKSAVEQFGALRSSGLRREDYLVPETTELLRSQLRGDGFHFQLFSDICPQLGIPLTLYPKQDISSAWAASVASGYVRAAPRRHYGVVEGRLRGAAKALLRSRSRQARCVLYNSNLSPAEICILAARSGFRIAWLPLVNLNSVRWPAPNWDLRRAFAGQLASILGATPFEKALREILPTTLPISLLEGLDLLKTVIADHFPQNRRTIVSGMAWMADDAFKLWCVQSLNRGSRLVSPQHGGGYGKRYLPAANEAVEYAVVDRFVSWGGSGRQARSHVTLPVPPHFLAKRGRATDACILYVGTAAVRWPIWIDTGPIGPMFLQHLDRQIEFWQALPPALRPHLLLRPNPDDLGWSAVQRLRRSVPQLAIDDCRQSFIKRLGKAKLAIVDNLNTTFLQSMGSGVPTILVWDPDVWLTNDIARTHFDDLEAAGVYFRCPKAAAAAVARIWREPQAWWESREVAAPVNRFLDRYMKRERNWSRPWLHELLS